MTPEEFKISFDRLVNAFSINNADRKARIYFEELGGIDGPAFAEAIRRIIRDEDRFPTIAKILKTSENVRPARTGPSEREKCGHCDGYGWVIFRETEFRGRCAHGQRLSQNIAFAPETDIDRINWTNRIDREWLETYGTREDT